MQDSQRSVGCKAWNVKAGMGNKERWGTLNDFNRLMYERHRNFENWNLGEWNDRLGK